MLKSLKITKYDIFLAVILLISAGLISFWSLNYHSDSDGGYVKVSQDNKEIALYELKTDREFDVDSKFGTNHVVIKDGRAFVEYSDCDNQYCVHSAPISKVNEQIVCLPHKLVLSITGGEVSEIDTVTN